VAFQSRSEAPRRIGQRPLRFRRSTSCLLTSPSATNASMHIFVNLCPARSMQRQMPKMTSLVSGLSSPVASAAPMTDFPSGLLALLGSHHIDIARYKAHFLAPALGARRFRGFMLGDGLGAFKLLPALLATIVVGWHGSNPTGPAWPVFYGR
jgi:hypothetical protein